MLQIFRSCFDCFSEKNFFLGEVGNAVKISLLLNYLKAVSVAALSECMEMIEKCGLQTDTFLEVLTSTSTVRFFWYAAILDSLLYIVILSHFQDSKLLQQKARIMRDQELPPVDRALKYVQQDLRNILTVADSCEQPMPLAATTNEVYKQSRRKGYSQEDYSTVHFKRR